MEDAKPAPTKRNVAGGGDGGNVIKKAGKIR